MKRNMILIMIGILLTITIVSAITVGQILTQQQIDNANIGLMDLNPSFETKVNGNLRIAECRTDADVCYAYVNVGTTIEPNVVFDNETGEQIEDSGYVVVNKTFKIPFRTTKYYDIAKNSSRDDAWTQLEADLKVRAKSKLREEVARIESFKTKEIQDKQTEIDNIIDGRTVGSVN